MKRGCGICLLLAVFALGVLLLTTCAPRTNAAQPLVMRLPANTLATATPTPTATTAEQAGPAVEPSPTVALYPPYTPPSPEARLVIPHLGIEGPVVPVGVTGEGEVESPTNGKDIGWYNLSPPPGSRGNSVLVGHVDYHGSTAVFWRLRELVPGDQIEYHDGNGGRATYRVEWVQSFPANAAPLDVVFASTIEGKLTLITCEGLFDPVTRNYQHRLVVRATYVGS